MPDDATPITPATHTPPETHPLIEASPEVLHAQAAANWASATPEEYAEYHARFQPETPEEAAAYAAAVNDRSRLPDEPLPPASAHWKTSMEQVTDGELDPHVWAQMAMGIEGLSQADADRVYALTVRDDAILSARQAEQRAQDAEREETENVLHHQYEVQMHPVAEGGDHIDVAVHDTSHDVTHDVAQADTHAADYGAAGPGEA